MTTKVIGEALMFLLGLPLFAFQTSEMIGALIEFLAEYPYNK